MALYEFLGVRKGSEGVWVTIYINIAIPKVVRVWHFTVVDRLIEWRGRILP